MIKKKIHEGFIILFQANIRDYIVTKVGKGDKPHWHGVISPRWSSTNCRPNPNYAGAVVFDSIAAAEAHLKTDKLYAKQTGWHFHILKNGKSVRISNINKGNKTCQK